MAPITLALGFDADGVVVDSEAVAWRTTEDILALFGARPAISSRAEQLSLFSRAAQAELVGADDASVLRSLHRILMRARASHVPVHGEVLSVVERLASKPVLITAAYADGVRRALGPNAGFFAQIIGREAGPKESLLAQVAAHGLSWFVTDTCRDIERCRACRVRCVAVGWGYDAPADLKAMNPEIFVSTPGELVHALAELAFITTEEV